ncbi:MAG: Flp pilus assembly complex ATPase component TadA [Phycisphaerae bacterium]|nr:Flp pilus assembly complex ATPase component TadA [Phycisphaerae bacterium]
MSRSDVLTPPPRSPAPLDAAAAALIDPLIGAAPPSNYDIATGAPAVALPTPAGVGPPRIRRQLGQILVARGLITAEQLEQALKNQDATGRHQLLGEVLLEAELVTEDQLVEALAEAYDIPYAKLTPKLADAKIVDLLPRDSLEKCGVLPLFRVDGVLTLAMSEPSNVFLIEDVARRTSCQVVVVAASHSDIQAMLGQHVSAANVFVIDDIIEDVNADTFQLLETQAEDITKLEGMAGDSPVIKLVNYILYTAVREGASDIHIEPDDGRLRVRLRVDGVLREKLNPPHPLQAPITSRIKIMAGLDIAERRLPQDGSIHVLMEGRPIDLRVSTLPNRYGEKVVIRIIDNSRVRMSMEKLGFSVEMLKQFRQLIEMPHGVFLVTGPTGSGKSTTLYAVLSALDSPQVNICTVEDPIEFNLHGINQFQVNEKIGLSFPTVLRSLLRQDPDVLMIGEVRDEETARTAIQAALTGHLVFSTLHTNDAPSAVTRLYHMGVEPYLISASVVGVLAQRLVRKICPKCKVAAEPPPHLKHAIERMGGSLEQVYRGEGCAACHESGFTGRIGIYELFVPNDAVRDAITDRRPLQDLRRLAREARMTSLYEDGLAKVRGGITTIEEVLRVCAA